MDWGEIFNDLAQAYGWTWDYIGNAVTLPVLSEIYIAWGRRPPLHWMAASYFGIGAGPATSPDEQPPPPPPDPAAIQALWDQHFKG